MEYVINSAVIEGMTDVLLKEFEPRFVAQMSNVLNSSGQQVVNAYNRVVFGEECIT